MSICRFVKTGDINWFIFAHCSISLFRNAFHVEYIYQSPEKYQEYNDTVKSQSSVATVWWVENELRFWNTWAEMLFLTNILKLYNWKEYFSCFNSHNFFYKRSDWNIRIFSETYHSNIDSGSLGVSRYKNHHCSKVGRHTHRYQFHSGVLKSQLDRNIAHRDPWEHTDHHVDKNFRYIVWFDTHLFQMLQSLSFAYWWDTLDTAFVRWEAGRS